jgi:hypothetical protein
MAMTNQQRFVASCESVGEADVRQKLNADRYGASKAVWASEWLEQVESAKTDATKAEERSSRLRVAAGADRHFGFAAVSALFLVGLLASAALFLITR